MKKGITGIFSKVLLLLLCSPIFQVYAEDPRSGSRFYLDTFGVVDAGQYPLADRVTRVFSRLLRVADKAEYKDPDILLINSDSWPWAIALPDNTVLVTRGAVDICYKGVSKAHGDARLAMILGHELGHLAEDDYWHRDVYLSLSNRPEVGASDVLRFIGERSGLVNANSEEWKTIVRDRELRADDRGFIYAALAGFDTKLLSADKSQSFFHYWTQETSAAEGDFHLTAKDRAAYLRARSGTLSETAELFHLGVALVHLGRLDQAESIFRKVLTGFPAHEVYNNLGYIKLQRSLDYISLDLGDLFWLPSTLDTSPRSEALATRDISAAIKANQLPVLLEDAVQYLRLAIKQNPSYLSAYLNLSTAYFYQQKFNSAAATLAEAQTIDPGNPEIESLWHIAMLNSLKGNVDYLPIATAKLEQLAKGRQPGGLLFNLAQLYETADQPQTAAAIWQQMGQHLQYIPEPYNTVVRLRLGVKAATPHGVERKFSILLAEQLKSLVNGSDQRSAINVDGLALARVSAPSGDLEYGFQGDKLIKINKISGEKTQSDLLGCCGEPTARVPTSLGEVWIYGDHWAALLEQGLILEVWQNGLYLVDN